MRWIHWAISHCFTYIMMGFAALSLYFLNFDMAKVFVWFLLPFYIISTVIQYVVPKVRAKLERHELTTDILSNSVTVLVVNSIQSSVMTIILGWSSTSALIHFGLISPEFGLAALPLWAQVLIGFAIFDFLFYVTHRLAHEVPFFWRFHSVHHCAHRVTVMNAYRVHPVDAMFRRYIPILGLSLTGITPEAIVATAVFGTVLGTVTHINSDLRHGWLNYFIATNELHRWHHSSKYSEAKNFAVLTIWDHLFGTFYYPKDRDMPAKTGLGDETAFPLHNYWQQLILPFRWKALETQQALAKAAVAPARPEASMESAPAIRPAKTRTSGNTTTSSTETEMATSA